jgi:hypothetical protein
MNHAWESGKRGLVAMALIAPFLLGGCNFATNSDYQTMYQAVGDAVIGQVSDNTFGNFGDEFDAVVRGPVTAFVQAMWDNYVAAHVPRDIELK